MLPRIFKSFVYAGLVIVSRPQFECSLAGMLDRLG